MPRPRVADDVEAFQVVSLETVQPGIGLKKCYAKFPTFDPSMPGHTTRNSPGPRLTSRRLSLLMTNPVMYLRLAQRRIDGNFSDAENNSAILAVWKWLPRGFRFLRTSEREKRFYVVLVG